MATPILPRYTRRDFHSSVNSVGLIGDGAVCIWHGLMPDALEDFYEWHNREHMPERVAIAGFRRGRRYLALRGSPPFFNLYEVDDPGVLGGADYLARLNAPTPWTRRVVASFRDVARALCDVAHSDGVGEGGFMLTLRFDIPAAQRVRAIESLRGRLLPPLAQRAGIAGVHLCIADERVSRIETAERQARAGATEVPTWIVLIEGTSAAFVERAGDALASSLADDPGFAVASIVCATYGLQHSCSDVARPATSSR
jgi:hypothetical protein